MFKDTFSIATFLPLHVIAFRLLLAIALGAVIGFEREWKSRPAGLRTHILVCLAAATASILTIEIIHMEEFGGESIRIDPIRLVEAMTSGVAFLAAGMIVFSRGKVHGITTGAGMWLAGIIGLGAGIGLWHIALLATVLALIILWFLRRLELYILGREESTHYPKQKKVK